MQFIYYIKMIEFNKLIKEARRYFTFIVGGGISLLINLSITFILTEFFKLWHMYSYTIALSVEILFLFTYHTHITFKARGHFAKFVGIVLLITLLNWIGVYVISVVIGINYLISIILVSLMISVLNYYLNKIWVFSSQNTAKQPIKCPIITDGQP